jgi:glycosyltransferase involved in cell wall biosynthesis
MNSTGFDGIGCVADSRLHVLHVFASFGIGGVPLRLTRIINHFGKRLRHTVISLDNDFEAAKTFAVDIDVELMPPPPPSSVWPRNLLDNIATLRRLRPGLMVTYNWGAIEWAMANCLWSVAPHIHCESGFGKEEAERQIARRVYFRRWALRRAKLVVPSHSLATLAREVWRIPQQRITHIPNGVDLARFSRPVTDLVSGIAPGELVIGTVAPLRPEKNLSRLLRVFAMLGHSIAARLVIAGSGGERFSLEVLAEELGIAERVVFTGQVAPEAVLGAFDVFALSSDTEQMPNALLEAMAASRAVVAVNVGDVRSMVCEENREFIVEREDIWGFAAAIRRLLADPEKRVSLGRQNRDRVAAEFSQEKMFACYARLFREMSKHHTGLCEAAVS